MSDTLLLAGAGHISEFAKDPTTGHLWNGTCTQTALEVCMACVDGRTPTQSNMIVVTKRMIDNKTCSANGASTLWAVAKYARDHGYTVAIEWDYQEPLQGDWHKLLLDNAGLRPILMQVAVGQALVDAETKSKDESELHYHAIAVVGKQDDGYIVADGDNGQVGSRFQIYSYATLAAARPCGVLVLDMKRPPVAAPVVKPAPAPVTVVTGNTPADLKGLVLQLQTDILVAQSNANAMLALAAKIAGEI